MTIHLSAEDELYLSDLFTWDEQKRPAELVVVNVSLVLGGLVIAVAAILTLLDPRDVVIVTVLVPGLLAGLFLIAIAVVARARISDRHRIALLARKLREGI